MATLTTSWQNVASYRFAPGTGFIATFYLDAKYSTQSQANNTTTIQTRLNCVINQGSGGGNGYKFTLSYGSTKQGSSYWTFETETITTGSATITHNNDGTKNLTLSSYLYVGYVGLDKTISANVTLPKINRYPQITNATNFTDEENPSMTFSNQGLYPVRVKIEAGGNPQLITRDISQTATSYTFELTTAERNALRQLAPNSKTLTTRFTVCAMNGNTELNSSYIDKTMTIVNANPTFTSAYLDTNSTTTAITNNNQQIIRNNSTLQINVTNAEAKKYSSLSSTKVVLNGITYNGVFSGSSAVFNIGDVNISENITAEVSVTDSRGYTTTNNLPITILDWQLPTGIIYLQRQNNYYSETDINVDADYYSLDNKNTISIKVRTKKTTDSSYGSYTTLQDNVTSVLTLDNNYQWNVQVLVEDRIGSTTYNLTIDRGIPIIFYDRTKRSVGINHFPSKNESLEINGDIYSKQKHIFPNSIIVANGEDSQTVNISSDYGEARLNIHFGNGYNYFDYFEVSNNRIVVKSDKVKKVLITGQCLCSRGPNGYISLYIRQNGTTISLARHQWVDWNGESLTTVPILVDVSENDYFELWFGGSKAGNYYKTTYGTYATVLSIQAIEIE